MTDEQKRKLASLQASYLKREVLACDDEEVWEAFILWLADRNDEEIIHWPDGTETTAAEAVRLRRNRSN